ncbi:hypothetical protein [Lactobacillus allii] [Lactiplantibacillus mudanjiangensis]|uniref:hypothetical protein n=1 Tax=Lactiplantibacillus mudanjiangensis TaxID=1296538 RepID=UPI001014BFD6|nr:hypothetical protein [Lactiplantibacillus mudanjiangensis]VDG33784.1 hypothetical protein [Lactobacillus allii] [Lactiplantibacillus mudanjiangensis]
MAEYTEAKKRANKKWDTEHKERMRYINSRSTARNFIKKQATKDDLTDFLSLISDRQQLLNDQNETEIK